MGGENSIRNISRNPWLKEFLIIHPPSFAISAKCCEKSKKQTAHDIRKSGNYDLDVQGVRKAEGGVRAISYSSCFDNNTFGCSKLRPLFWWKKSDCLAYDEVFGVEHSACYTKYGLDRTGCSCCPFGKHWERELYAAKQYEPGLYKVAVSTFRMSYEYMSEYHEFRKEKNLELC